MGVVRITKVPIIRLVSDRSPYLSVTINFSGFRTTHRVAATVVTHKRHRVTCLNTHLSRHAVVGRGKCRRTVLSTNLIPCDIVIRRSSSCSSNVRLVHRTQQRCPRLSNIFYAGSSLTINTTFRYRHLKLGIPSSVTVTNFRNRSVNRIVRPQLTDMLAPHRQVNDVNTRHLLTHVHNRSIAPGVLSLNFALSPNKSVWTCGFRMTRACALGTQVSVTSSVIQLSGIASGDCPWRFWFLCYKNAALDAAGRSRRVCILVNMSNDNGSTITDRITRRLRTTFLSNSFLRPQHGVRGVTSNRPLGSSSHGP